MLSEFIESLCTLVTKTIRYVDFAVIRFFADEKYKLIPIQWIEEHSKMDISSILNGDEYSEVADSLTSIMIEARKLKFPDFNGELYANLGPSVDKDVKIGFNKYRQLIHFGRLLIDLCKENRVERVFDVGCGLGHLLGWLAKNSELELIGLDYNQILCDKATNLYEKIKFYNIDITNQDECTALLYSEAKRSAIISLHGCGDVQSILIRQFIHLDPNYVPLLLVIGCCYHKMSFTEHNKWLMSETFRSKLKVDVNKHTLRLASEYRPSTHFSSSLKNRQNRVQSCITRGVTEIFYEKMNLSTLNEHRSKRRKLGNSFEEIKNELLRRYNIEGDERERWINTYDKVIEENKPFFPYVEVYLDLQYMLQEVYEALVLYDRVAFIQENNIFAELRPVFDISISPRNMCIISVK